MTLLGNCLYKVALLVFIFVGVKKFCFRKCYISNIALITILIFSGLAAQLICFAVPPLTDEITLTALGTKNEAAQTNEIYLRGLCVDGKDYSIQEPIEGKWFWAGENYAWRNETDSRQPSGTTQSITLKVPVGTERTIIFECDIWRGNVEVGYMNHVVIYDTFENTKMEKSFPLYSSTTQKLVASTMIGWLVYSIFFLVFAFLCLFSVQYFRKRDGHFYQHKYYLIYAGIAAASLVIMIILSNWELFWGDEIFNVGVAVGTPSFYSALVSGNDINLFNGILHIWNRLVPYGEQWLYLLPELATALSVYLVGLLSREATNKVSIGSFAALFAGLSQPVIIQCGLEARPYSFLLLFSTCSLYLFFVCKRKPQGENICVTALFGICMAAAAYSHYFGIAFCAILFCVDIFYMIKLHTRITCVYAYIIAAVLYLPNVYILLFSSRSVKNIYMGWQGKPNPESLFDLLHYLSGYSDLAYILFLLGGIISIVFLIFSVVEKKQTITAEINGMVFFIEIAVIIVAIYINGIMHPQNTLWEFRYFVCLIPCFAALMGIGTEYILQLMRAQRGINGYTIIVLLLIVLYVPEQALAAQRIVATGDAPFSTGGHPFEDVANWLYHQENYIYNRDTLVLDADEYWFKQGFDIFYMQQEGQRDAVNVYSQQELSTDEILNYNRIYILQLVSEITEENIEFIEDNYVLVETYRENVRVFQKEE